jgi:hypothetical protein
MLSDILSAQGGGGPRRVGNSSRFSTNRSRPFHGKLKLEPLILRDYTRFVEKLLVDELVLKSHAG